VPELDPADIDDLMLGCGLPGGEQGFNTGRVVAVLLGLDRVPGTTITRYCASSLQTSRMAMHAIKAGEGDVFISAGVETVSRYLKGNSDAIPDTQNPVFADAATRVAAAAANGATSWTDPRDGGELPDVYIDMGQTAETAARTSPKRPPSTASGSRRSPRSPCPTAPSSPPTTAPAPASPSTGSAASSRCSAPTAGSPPATPARSTTAPPP
jgi:hypothetical protein